MSTEIKALDLNDDKSFRVYMVGKLSEIRSDIKGVNNRLDTLNGKVAKHESYIVADEAAKLGEDQLHYVNCNNTKEIRKIKEKDIKELVKFKTQVTTAKNILIFFLSTVILGLGGFSYRIYTDTKAEKTNTEIIMKKLEMLIDKK